MKSDMDALMWEKKIDVLMVLGAAEHNPPMYYFTGGGHISAAVLIKKFGEDPVLFYNEMERDEAARTGLQIRSMGTYSMQDLLKEAEGDLALTGALRYRRMFNDIGLSAGRVAIYGNVEIGSSFATIKKFQSLMPNLEIIGENGMDSVFMRAMETKDENDVERIRRIGLLTTEVVRRTADFLMECQVGRDDVLLNEVGDPLTVGDVHAKIRLWVAELGAELPEGFIFSIGRDAGVPHSSGNPADLLRLGQTIVYDIYPAERGGGYFYDFTRTWSLGYATTEAELLYGQVKEIFNRLLDEFSKGASFKDYQRITCEYFESKGHKSQLNTENPLDGYVHSLGHGVGLNIHERPFSGLQVDDSHRLLPGVVFTSEPGLYYPEKGMGFRIEDTLWMRPDGKIEILADYPYDFVLPMKNWRKQ